MKYPLYVQVGGLKYWHCEHCCREVVNGARCVTCGSTVRQRRRKK